MSDNIYGIVEAPAPAHMKLMRNKCKVDPDVEDFGFLKKGNRNKLCHRHEKARKPILERLTDNWDDFVNELKACNDPVSIAIVNTDPIPL